MKKIALLITALAVLFCLLALSVSAAEPSASNEFGEVTLIDDATLNSRDDYGYSEGDTARVVLQIPGTDTYMTYPAYYIMNSINKDGGLQAVDYYAALNAASGYEFTAASVIRIEFPNVFIKFSGNYFGIGNMTSLKYVRFQSNMDTIFSFKGNKSVETVVFDDNPNPDAKLNITASAFENCSSIKEFDMPIHWTSMGERSFAGCTSLTTIELSSRIDSIGTAAFLNCTALETVVIPEENAITRIKHRAFDSCSSLSGSFVFEHVTHIESSAFKYAATAEGASLTMSFPAIVDVGCTGGDSHVFSYSGISELSFGKTLQSLSLNSFTKATKLWRIEFEGCAQGFEFRAYTFEECTALKAVSLPEGITALPNRMFRRCTSLTAVYLPSTLTAINSGDNDHATFKNCTSLYFVSEPFTYKTASEIPSEPSIYYFPKNIATLSSEAFDNSRINDVVVLPEALTSLTQGYTFEGCTSASGNPTVVFLGDMTAVNIRSWSVNKIYFCNPADVDFASAGATNDKRVVFCYAEGNTDHLSAQTGFSQEANCIENKMTYDLCFCGTKTNRVEEEGTAIGHDYSGTVSYEFTTASVAGVKCTVCVNGCGIDKLDEVAPVYEELGVSYKLFTGGTYSFTNGYLVNRESLELYESEKKVTLTLGFAFGSAASLEGQDITLESFTFKAEVANQAGTKAFAQHEFVVSYATDEHLDKDIVIAVYVTEKSEEGEVSYFINRDSDLTVGVGGFIPLSYNSVIGK